MYVRCLLVCRFVRLFFFFKQKTAYEMRISDWSSDVCSSDLQYFILGFALLVGLLFLGRWFVEADPHKLAGGLKWGGFAIAAVVLVLLLVSGRLGLLAALVPAGIDRKSTRLNSSHSCASRLPSSA